MKNTVLVKPSEPDLHLLPFYHRIGGVEYPILLRRTIIKKLIAVTKNLPNKYKLQIDSGYRSLETQQNIWNSRYKYFKLKNPSKSPAEIKSMTNKLIFNPKLGTPPHSTGAAVDISLLDENLQEINLSAPLPYFFNEPQLKSDKISRKSQKLRNLIRKLMLEQGFAPHPQEYWHFSFGDKIWANYYQKKSLFKKPIEPKDYRYSNVKIRFLEMYKKIILFYIRRIKKTNLYY